jgi:outer membrane lipoprotein SlyB
MTKAFATLLFLAAMWANAGCSSKAFYGGMIGAGVGGLQGEAVSGALIGAGVGGMIDQMEDEEQEKPK